MVAKLREDVEDVEDAERKERDACRNGGAFKHRNLVATAAILDAILGSMVLNEDIDIYTSCLAKLQSRRKTDGRSNPRFAAST